MNRIYLASGSPRRRELIERLGFAFELLDVNADEHFDLALSPEENVCAAAVRKATAGKALVTLEGGEVLLGIDTIVVLDGQVLGKPKDRADAAQMLAQLSGKTHLVLSGVGIIGKSRSLSLCESTSVRFEKLSAREIESYLDCGEALDKAGAYGIQGMAARYISAIDGDYYNVVGFPLSRIYRTLVRYFGFGEAEGDRINEHCRQEGTESD